MPAALAVAARASSKPDGEACVTGALPESGPRRVRGRRPGSAPTGPSLAADLRLAHVAAPPGGRDARLRLKKRCRARPTIRRIITVERHRCCPLHGLVSAPTGFSVPRGL